MPAGDFSTPPRAAEKSFDPSASVKVDSATTESSEVFENADGSQTMVVTAAPVRAKDSSGRWVAIDLSPVAAGDGTVSPKASPADTQITSAPDGLSAVLATSAGPIVIHPSGQAEGTAARAKPSERGVAAPDALDGRELRYDFTVGGVEESVVLASPAATAAYAVTVTAPAGVSAEEQGQAIVLRNKSGVVATYGGGVAVDAAGATGDVSVRLGSVVGDVAMVEVSVDAGWLADPKRVFPVVIDPSVVILTNASGAFDGTSYDAGNIGDGSDLLKTGNDRFGGTARSWVRFPAAWNVSPTGVVSSAVLELYHPWVDSSTSSVTSVVRVHEIGGPIGAGLAQPADVGVITSQTITTYETFYDFDITSLAQKWVSGLAPNYGFMLDSDPSGLYANKPNAFYAAERAPAWDEQFVSEIPHLYITWNSPPPAASQTGATPADDAVSATATPTLSVTPVVDPDGSQISYWFQVSSGGVTGSGAIAAQSGGLPRRRGRCLRELSSMACNTDGRSR